MKKQLLIVLVAFFVIGLSNTYGQDCPTPRPVDITCLTSNALNPVAGTPYDYTIDVPTPLGTKEYTWFVTQDINFIASGVLTANREVIPTSALIAATGVGYNDPATGTNTVQITWKAFVYDPLAPVFVLIHVKNMASTPDACVTNNMKVYKIEPQIAFTLDIANVTKAGVTQTFETQIDRCIHEVVSATYNAVAPEGVVYDFGKDTLYYVVTAGNYNTSWLPSAQVTGYDPLETIEAVEWDTSFDFNNPVAMTDIVVPGTYVSVTPAVVRNVANAVGPEGECIWVRVIIDHTNGANNYQGLTDETITVALDGQTNLAGTPVPDIHYSATLPAVNALCGLPDGFQFDLALQTIKPRPDIQDATPPAGDDFLPVQP